AGERKRVLGIVEEESVLSAACPAMQTFLQLANDVRKVRDRALGRLQHVHALDGIPQPAFFLEVETVSLSVALNQHTEEAEQELQVLFRLWQRERIDSEIARLLADIQVRAAEDRGQRLEAAADIEDEGQRRVFLCILQQEIGQIGLPTACHPEDQRVRNLPVMQIQEVRCAVVGFEHGQVLGAEICIRLLAGKDRKQERQVGVVRVEQIQLAKVQRIVARHDGEIGVELIVGFRKQAAVAVGKDARKLGSKLLQFGFRAAVEDNRQRELAQRLTVAQGAQAIAKVLNV